MAYRIDVERRALKALRQLPREDRERIMAAIDALATEPRPVGCVPVRDAPKGTYRVRVGGYRIIYLALDSEQAIIVARVARRSESTYRDLD